MFFKNFNFNAFYISGSKQWFRMLTEEKYDTAEPRDVNNVFGAIECKVVYSFRTLDYFSRLKRARVVCWQHKITKTSEDPAMLGAKNAKSQKSSKSPQPAKKRQVGPTQIIAGGE